ncbi:arsinothricin resistance N-acetyltransferase ArsN1 family B [Modestobacter sp. NPDC049651]|uniref:arsinothricin resistance N-acetyltransferase ArsN1 family B n=1 Tax=unclassified Modestobacter TaxID=2643866 RepID=UPI00340B0A58
MTSAPAVVRPADVPDAAAVAAVYAPYVTGTAASFESEAPDAAELARRMLRGPRLPWLVAERDGEVVGYAYAGPHGTRPGYRWTVDCSVYLVAGEQGRGTGRALYRRLLPEVRRLGYVTAYAGIALPNPGSVGLHESLGFTAVGVYRQAGFKLGRWLDVGWWQLPLATPPEQPAEPRAWAPHG